MPDDFTDLEDARSRIFRALADRFDSAGFVVFDETFQMRPSVKRIGQAPAGAEYQVEFKIADQANYDLHNMISTFRRNSSSRWSRAKSENSELTFQIRVLRGKRELNSIAILFTFIRYR